MHALVVYESMYGNTHVIADAVADGIGRQAEVRVLPVGAVTPELLEWADLVVVGGPTHVHGMARARTRDGAREAAAKPESGLTIDPEGAAAGLREWMRTLPDMHGKRAAAFDTRMHGPALLTGRASVAIAGELRRHGATLVAEPESFMVDRQHHLAAGEDVRAVAWAASLAPVPVAAG